MSEHALASPITIGTQSGVVGAGSPVATKHPIIPIPIHIEPPTF